MNCAWQALLNLLPPPMRQDVDRLGRDKLQELRLRRDCSAELICIGGTIRLQERVTSEILQYVVNAACRYSPWTAATAADGYITAQGGHRVGLCGDVVVRDGVMTDVRCVTSLCIRVARDFPGIGKGAPATGSLLILGRPGSGKTTLLRDIIRTRSEGGQGSVAVVDERRELFPTFQGKSCFPPGCRTDVLSGCPKGKGIDLLLRTMGPTTIAVDEITAQEDCEGLLKALWCGVDLIATAHAGSVREFTKRTIYKPLIDSRVFSTVLVMRADKTWREERIPV